MNGNNDLQYDHMISEIRSKRSLDYDLKEDLIEAVQDCKNFAVSFFFP